MKYIKVIIDNDENETYELRACKFLKWDYDINKKKKRGIHYEDS